MLPYLLDTILIRFGTKLHNVGILMGTYYAPPLVADLVLVYNEKDCIVSLSDDTQADIIEALNSISR